LLALALPVLALHLLLLHGGLPDFMTPALTTPTKVESSALQPTQAESDRSSAAVLGNPVVRVSTVRWIVPTPVAAPEMAVPARSAVTAPPPARTRPRPSALEPAVGVAQVPVAEPPVAEALVPPTEAAPPVDTVVLAQAASAEPPTAEPAPASPEPVPAPAGKPLPPAQPPASTRLQYVVAGQAKGFHYNATGTLDWELGDGRYSARMEMRMPLLGSRVQTSAGGVGPEGLMPERFADKGRSERAAHFERAAHRIRFSINTPDAELLPGAQDRLSLFLQVAGLLQARPQAYAAGQVIDMQVAGTADAEIWRFQVGEESTLALPAGELRVRHLVRQPRKEFDSTVEMWLAPELHHLPVRLKVTQANGDMADQQLSQKP
jgi:hypothetical protein